MKSKKTGVSMGGAIEYTRTKEKQRFINKIESVKKKNAKVCVDCESNKEGYCTKHKGWCSKVNHICNGYEMSYQEKLQKNKYDRMVRKQKQEQKKANKKAKKKVKKK